MPKLEGHTSGNIAEVDSGGFVQRNRGRLRVTKRPVETNASNPLTSGLGGAHVITGVTGLLTGASLGSNTTFATFLNNTTTRVALIRRIEVTLAIIGDLTSAQRLGFNALYMKTDGGFTGGTNLMSGMATNSYKKRSSHTTSDAIFDVAQGTAMLGIPGSGTVRDDPFFYGSAWARATSGAPTVQHFFQRWVWDSRQPANYPILLEEAINGFRAIEFRNTDAMTASGSQRWTVCLEWDYYDRSNWQSGQLR